MFERRSLSWPITLGVLMIVTIVVLAVGWVLLGLVGASIEGLSSFFWTWLPIGAALLTFVLVGVVLYLTLSIKAINLTRRQSNFIDSVTHELKSPIASLKLYLQTLMRHSVTEQEREDFYKFMMEDVERLDTLISNLLDVARFDRSGDDGGTEDVSLEQVLRHSSDMACARHNVPFSSVTLNVDPCTVNARPVELEMIFRNLIDNALKYGSENPQVQVQASVQSKLGSDQEVVLVDVSDNGRGIPSAMRKHIFGRFVRLGQELEREKPGIGLGLYIVRTLVERLRGRIKVFDRTEGTGATFEVQLPCRRLAKDQAANDDKPRSQPATGSSAETISAS